MKKNVIVFGSYATDMVSRAPHLPVPGETVKGSSFQMSMGGKGMNQGIAAHKAGANVSMVTKVGQDLFGEQAVKHMRALGMDDSHVFISQEQPTATALITVDENTGQNAILVVLGASGTFTPEDIAALRPLMRSAGFLLVQLETNLDAVERVVDMAYHSGLTVILNPAPIQPVSDALYEKINLITPNEIEAQTLTGISVTGESGALTAAEFFFEKGVPQVVITLGKKGAFAATPQAHRLIPAKTVAAVDTTGAGDAFNGALTAALAEGADLFRACEFANAAAALSVTRPGAGLSMPTRAEIETLLAQT